MSNNIFDQIDRKLGDGWACMLISTLTPGVVRLQLANEGGVEFGWRKCIEASTLESAIKKAIEFTHSKTPYEYMMELEK